MSGPLQSKLGRLALALVGLTLASCAGGRKGVEQVAEPRPAAAEEEAEPSGEAEASSSASASSEAAASARPELPPRPLTPAQRAAMRVASLEIVPSAFELKVGDKAVAEVIALDATGKPVEGAQILRLIQGGAAWFDPGGLTVNAVEPGDAVLLVGVRKPSTGDEPPTFVRGSAPIRVLPLPVAWLELSTPETPFFAGTRRPIHVSAYSEKPVGDEVEVFERKDFDVTWESSDEAVVRITPNRFLQAGKPGWAKLTATSEGVSASIELEIKENPIRELRIVPAAEDVKVGDVARFSVLAADGRGRSIENIVPEWTLANVSGVPVEAASIDAEGAFVASFPGLYRVVATVGSLSATAEVMAEARPARRDVQTIGHAPIPERSTSDLWVFEGLDGRDYAYTGTHAGGKGGNVMYAWDVTNPSNPVLTDSVTVDARVVNDVKVNKDATLAVITREGAHDRKNGIVILNLQDPAHPAVISSFTKGLTAGIHNTWIEGDLVYAINNGTRALHIIDISDPWKPKAVGRWELKKQNKYLHDVMIKDGLAYLSYWNDGLVILDVGAGIKGGTPTRPKLVSQFKYRTRVGSQKFGNTHHAIRYKNYVFVSDEIFGCKECINGPRGYVHVIDVTDLEKPVEVARFQVPEAGTHNLWVEDDRLYIAYYQGGLRVVDVSGELRGDLYRQGREIGWFMTESDDGFEPNATMAWGPQPHKGNIFVSDMNSGLWILQLQGPEQPLVP